MNLFSPFTRKLSILSRRNGFRNELNEEMEFHRTQVAKELEAGGVSPENARSAARRQFGNETRLPSAQNFRLSPMPVPISITLVPPASFSKAAVTIAAENVLALTSTNTLPPAGSIFGRA